MRCDLGRRASGALAGGLLMALGCSSGRLAAPAPPEIDFTQEDLEEIRGVVIQYLEDKKPENWQSFLVELRRDAVFPKKEYPDVGPSIGIWKCEADEDGVALVRHPPLNPETGLPGWLYFGVILEKKDGRWTATDHFTREERWEVQN